MSRWEAGSTLERLTPAATVGCLVPRFRCRVNYRLGLLQPLRPLKRRALRRVVAGHVTVKACCGPGVFPFGVTENLPAQHAQPGIIFEQLAVCTWLWSKSLKRLCPYHAATPTAKYSWWFTDAYLPFQSPAFIAASYAALSLVSKVGSTFTMPRRWMLWANSWMRTHSLS